MGSPYPNHNPYHNLLNVYFNDGMSQGFHLYFAIQLATGLHTMWNAVILMILM